MAINVANTDFIQRVTPHPQAASPLQQLIAEDQQAKGDPGDDEIEGLDAEVLLNANTLEDGEPVTLDFKGQAETPSLQPSSARPRRSARPANRRYTPRSASTTRACSPPTTTCTSHSPQHPAS